MADTSDEQARVGVNIRLSKAGVAAVDRLAAAEERTRSSMVRVLLSEAIRARATRGDDRR